MFNVPSDETIATCTITKGVVDGTEKPVLTHRDPQEVTRKAKGRSKARTGGEDV
jgi:ATP-dependent protease Clp ATPase subunit